MGGERFAKIPFRNFNPLSQLLSQLYFEIHMFSFHKGTSQTWRGNDYYLPANLIYFITGGDGEIVNNGQVIPLIPGNAYLIPINSFLSHSCKTRIEKFWTMFSLEIFSTVDILQSIDECINLGKFDLGETDSVNDRIKRNGIADYLYFESMIFQLLSRLENIWENIFDKKVYQDKIYRQIFKYIHEHINTVIRIEELSDHINMSSPQLSRMFKSDMGQTLKSFINQKKYQRACALLTGTNLKSKDIASEVGFEDEYYFIRFFKKHCGISPTQFRRQKFPG